MTKRIAIFTALISFIILGSLIVYSVITKNAYSEDQDLVQTTTNNDAAAIEADIISEPIEISPKDPQNDPGGEYSYPHYYSNFWIVTHTDDGEVIYSSYSEPTCAGGVAQTEER